jgi:hypothetical protein
MLMAIICVQFAEHLADEWPGKDECDTFVQKVPDPRNLSTSYLSPENKGFESVSFYAFTLKTLLSFALSPENKGFESVLLCAFTLKTLLFIAEYLFQKIYVALV